MDGFNHELSLAPGTDFYSIPIDDNVMWDCRFVEPFLGDYQRAVTFESRYPVEYFITVMEPEAAGPTPYRISVTPTDSVDAIGETPATAAEIERGQLINSDLGVPNDADLFSINAEQGQAYEIDFAISGESSVSVSVLYASAYGLYLRSNHYGRGAHWGANASEENGYSDSFSGAFIAQSDRVYLMVNSLWWSADVGTYEFTLRALPDIDNDNTTSVVIPVDKTHNDSIDHVDDVDNFTFVEVARPVEHEIRIRDDMYERHQSFGSWSDREGGPFKTTYTTAKSGEHHIRIANWNRTDYSISFTPIGQTEGH